MSLKKRITSITVIISIIFTVIPLQVGASNAMSFEEYVIKQLTSFKTEFDVTEYALSNNWDSKRVTQEVLSVIATTPSLYFVKKSCGLSYIEGKKYTANKFIYTMTKSDYDNSTESYEKAIQKALAVVLPGMSDYEKALALHDYLALNIEYNTKEFDPATGKIANKYPKSYTSYGALVDGIAVCEGYSLAYMELLTRVGIESAIVTSDKARHAWNYVKIAQNWYHVDITSDDPLLSNKYDMLGYVSHDFFLINDSELVKFNPKLSSSKDWDTRGLPKSSSTTYSKAFWRGVKTSLSKANDSWYWLELDTTSPGYNGNNKKLSADEFNDNFFKIYSKIMKYSTATGKKSQIYKFYATWFKNGSENKSSKSWQGDTYAKLAIYNGRIYFNTTKEIQSIDLNGKNLKSVVKPSLNGKYIYGMNIVGNKLQYTIQSAAAQAKSVKTGNLPTASSIKIRLNKSSVNTTVGKTFATKKALTPQTSKDFVYYVSANPAIATINASGIITGVKKGTTEVYAYTESGIFAICKVQIS